MIKKKYLLLIAYIFTLSLVSFVFFKQIIEQFKITPFISLLFFISCFVAGYSIIFIETNIKKIFLQETKEEFNLKKIKLNTYEINSLIILILFSITTWNLTNNITLLTLFLLLVIMISSSLYLIKINKISKYLLRYIFEIPKLFVAFLLVGISPKISIIMLIISIGSFFYVLIPRGLFLFEIFLSIIFFFQGYYFTQLIAFILIIRILGSIIFNIPFLINKIFLIKKFPRQNITSINISFKDLFKKTKTIENSIINSIKEKLNIHSSKILIDSSSRDSFYFILKELKHSTKKKKVLISAFNFSLMKNIILKAGFEPIFIDVENNDFNMSISDLKNKIDSECGIAILTHILGAPINPEIIDFLKSKKIIIIEDCAHTFNSIFPSSNKRKNYFIQKTGTLGDISVFSFNFSKPISSTYGAAIVLNNLNLNKINKLFQKIKNNKKRFSLIKEIEYYIKANFIIMMFNEFIFSIITYFIIKLTYNSKNKTDFIDEFSKDNIFYNPKKLVLMNKLGLILLNRNLQKITVKNKTLMKTQKQYDDLFKENNNIDSDNNNNLVQLSSGTKYLYALKVRNKIKAKFFLWKHHIDIKQIYCKDISSGECKNSKILENSIIYLPFHPSLKRREIFYITKIVNKYNKLK